MRIVLGIPTAGTPSEPFLSSLASLELPPYVQAFERSVVVGNFVPAQRDVLLERAIDWEADVIVMCDDDMVLPPNALDGLCGLLQSDPRVAIAGALYYSRDGLRPMVVDGWDPNDVAQGWIPAFDDRTPVPVAGVGFGCVAIRLAAVAAFARPFFAAQIFVERAAGRVRVCNEDYLFCRRTAAAGHVVALHPGVRCKHYDRGRGVAMPPAWESLEASAVPRVLTRTGDAYALTPLANAPDASTGARKVRADVTYVESDSL